MLASADRVLTPLLRLSLLLYPPAAFAALFTFDAPGSSENPYAYLFASGILLYGPAVVVTQIVRAALVRGHHRAVGAWLGMLPLAFAGQALAGVVLLSLLCGGSFACR